VRLPLSPLAPARRRLVLIVLACVVIAIVAVVGILVVHRLAGAGIAEQSRPGPVVLVPGYGGDVDSLDPWAQELRSEGRDVVVLRPTGGGTGDLRVQAARLGDLAERTLERTGARSLDLVGYSAGGVVLRIYLRDGGGASVVRRVLTVGSPHHGTEVATIAEEAAGGCPKACEQLATGSELLRRLAAGDETPTGPRWATVRTAEDETVTPVDSAELEGALNVEVQDLCPAATTSHGALPGDPVVLAMLRGVLGRAAPTVPEDVTC
jgi:triacylglycerol lipase